MKHIFLSLSVLMTSSINLMASTFVYDDEETVETYAFQMDIVNNPKEMADFEEASDFKGFEIDWQNPLSKFAPKMAEALKNRIQKIENPLLVIGGGLKGLELFNTGRHVILDLHEESQVSDSTIVIGGFDFNHMGQMLWLSKNFQNTFETIMFDVGTVHHARWNRSFLTIIQNMLKENGTFYYPVTRIRSTSFETPVTNSIKNYNAYTTEYTVDPEHLWESNMLVRYITDYNIYLKKDGRRTINQRFPEFLSHFNYINEKSRMHYCRDEPKSEINFVLQEQRQAEIFDTFKEYFKSITLETGSSYPSVQDSDRQKHFDEFPIIVARK